MKPLRLWPGVLAAALLLLVKFVVPAVVPESFMIGFFGSHLCALAILVWWMFFSRAPWSERVGALVLMILAMFATSRLVHESIARGQVLLYLWAIPTLAVALVVWAVASRRLSTGLRRASMVATILLAAGCFTLVRIAGVTGNMASELHWRWTPTPEQRLLAQARNMPAGRGSTPSASETKADWPGFRGPERDGIVRGVRIETDWSKSPPVQLWRRPVGPGWSSFAVGGGLLYTQEQLGEEEVVSCYDLTTGKPVWMHRDPTRFDETAGGAGPRATPTLSNGRVYTFGATGTLNALDAGDGAVVWSRNVVADAGAKVPDWGFASSPVVAGDIVIIAAASQLVAYDLASGDLRWKGPVHGGSFSSPHLLTIDGVEQVLLVGRDGATSVAPGDGTKLWEHPWPGVGMLQPAVITGGDLLISTTGPAHSIGLRRIAVTHGPGGWTSQERWTSTGLKPYFNDFVVHKGHAYGFDGFILSCIDVEDGNRMWKGGRYGNGQLLLLADQDLLLVVSEQGELALVSATPDQFRELARFPAIEGKTWNHPVLVGDVLLVRNGQEMAAFRLTLATRAPEPPAVGEPRAYVFASPGGTELKAYVFSSNGDSAREPRSGIVLFYGGGWAQGEPAWAFARARHFAERGMVAVAAQYRLSDQKSITPIEAMADARAVIRWMRSQATSLRIDPNRIAAYGWSAGAHLAASAAIFDDAAPGVGSASPNALILVSPAVSLESDQWFQRLLGQRANARDLSPDLHVREGLPPTLILEGSTDTVTPLSSVKRFCERLVAAKNRCELHVYEGVGHLFTPAGIPDDGQPKPDPATASDALSRADRFLTSLGFQR